MKRDLAKVNKVLAEWNPIGIPDNVAKNEYVQYAKDILDIIDDKHKLEKYLEDILLNKMGLDYDSGNKDHKDDVLSIVEKLHSLPR